MFLKALQKNLFIVAIITSLPLTSYAETIILGPGKVSSQIGTSYSLSFENPIGFEEDKVAAENNGFVKIYVPKGLTLNNTQLIISVAFKEKTTSKFKNLNEFIMNDIENYKKLYKNAKINMAKLPENITNKFKNNKFSHMAILFNDYTDKVMADAIVLFFETPAGFWSITYTSPKDIQYKTRDIFLKFVKDIEIEKK